MIRTSPYGVLGMHGRGAATAFEVDQFDYANHRGGACSHAAPAR